MKTFWLSFADEDGFRGACVVDVSAEDAEAMLTELAERFPDHQPSAEWIAAATRKAHQLGINPGGQVLTADITDLWSVYGRFYQKDRLYPSKAELEIIDAQIAQAITVH